MDGNSCCKIIKNCYNRNMEQQVLDFIAEQELILPGETVGVAVSGGMDSMALLFLLHKLGFAVKALHFEHGIRGQASKDDAEFVRRVCLEKGIPFVSESADVPAYAKERKQSIETAARILRYDFFSRSGCKKIATAHHADDCAESILMHVLRGSGLAGLVGIQPKNGRIIRPLLCVSKTEIRQYIRDNQIPFCEDETNFDLSYRRNYLRREIMPKLREINPALTDALLRLSRGAQDVQTLLRRQAEKIRVIRTEHTRRIDRRELLACNEQVAARLLFDLCAELGQEHDLEYPHISEMLGLAMTGAHKHIKGRIYARCEYGSLILYTQEEPKPEAYCVPFSAEKTVFPAGILQRESRPYQKNAQKDLEFFGRIPKDAVVRTRRAGDVFCPLGSGQKKLKDYFIDIKLPRSARDRVPLLASGREIIWVIGCGISERYKVTDAGTCIALHYIKGE